MHGCQRGRARSVHGDAWPAQIETVRDPVGSDTVGAAGRRMRTDAGMSPRSTLNPLIFIVRDSEEQTEIGAALEIEHYPRVFHRFPGCLQEQPVLGINVRSFPRGNSEKLGVKLINAVQEATAAGDRFTRQTR